MADDRVTLLTEHINLPRFISGIFKIMPAANSTGIPKAALA